MSFSKKEYLVHRVDKGTRHTTTQLTGHFCLLVDVCTNFEVIEEAGLETNPRGHIKRS